MRLWTKGLLGVVALLALATAPAQAAEFDKFGFESVAAEISTHQAGEHPDFFTKVVMKTDPSSPEVSGDHFPYAALKDVAVALPLGMVGNLNAVDTCETARFVTSFNEEEAEPGCPFSSQVGTVTVRAGDHATPSTSSIYMLERPGSDTVARFGFFVSIVPVFINVRLRSDGDYGITAEVSNMAAVSPVRSVETTFWGVPANSSHDQQRLTPVESGQNKTESPPRSFGRPPAPFLSNPTACGQQLTVGFAADSYQEPGRFDHASASLGEIVGCEALSFEPSLSLTPTTSEAATPSGMDATLAIPQHEGFDERSTSHLQDAIIRLPEGMTISPGAADGLAACSEDEVGFSVSPPRRANCPDASKIADAEIDSPSLSRPIGGAVYQRTPEPGHLTRAWLVADELGVHIKIPGEFQLDPDTGRVTSLFLDTPQVPLRNLKLHFFGGPRGVLSTPRSCGTYQAEYDLIPWSGAGTATGAIPLSFDQNCATGGFTPDLQVGATTPVAGAFTALVTTFTQPSGQQNLARLSLTMSPGVLAKLKGVPLCPDVSAADGSCPSGSQVGRSTIATGLGPNPLWIPQPGKSPTAVFLAGPYQGAPYSLVIKTPAEAGPFDLGDVVVRVALKIDPTTIQVTAVSDLLPQILEGIPVTYRSIRIDLDRPEFAVNPTSCDPMPVLGTATSIASATATLTDRFQVGGCGRLSFKPRLALSLSGKTTRAGNPALSANLRMPKRGANIAWTRVTLPPSLQIDNAHINNPCTRVQFDAGDCPKSSILGKATAVTPLLDSPLRGPVYFRSNGGERELPDLVADLRGPIHVVLIGYIDSKKKRIRTTFAQVPDAPISRFAIRLFGGKRGLLENNRSLCAARRTRVIAQFNGQNGKISDSALPLGVPCGKKRRP